MLLDPEERTIVSSLGWVDGGALWLLDVETGLSGGSGNPRLYFRRDWRTGALLEGSFGGIDD